MNKVSYEKLEKALKRLKEQFENFLKLDNKNLSKLDKEAVKESVIQRFEICYDSFFKSLRKYLQDQGVSLKDFESPKKLLRKANENGLMDQEAVASWFSYIDLRIGTAHDYSLEKVDKALSKMGDFIEDVDGIYQIMDETEHENK